MRKNINPGNVGIPASPPRSERAADYPLELVAKIAAALVCGNISREKQFQFDPTAAVRQAIRLLDTCRHELQPAAPTISVPLKTQELVPYLDGIAQITDGKNKSHGVELSKPSLNEGYFKDFLTTLISLPDSEGNVRNPRLPAGAPPYTLRGQSEAHIEEYLARVKRRGFHPGETAALRALFEEHRKRIHAVAAKKGKQPGSRKSPRSKSKDSKSV